jgi:hypothetical protein
MASGFVNLPAFRAPGPLNFSGLNEGIEVLGQGFKENRLLDQSKQIGSAIQSGGYGDGADAAFAQGNISLGTQLAGVEQSDEDRDFNRNRLMTQDRRAAGADARSQELHGLNVQSTRDDIQTKLTGRVAGVAQMIRNEQDPQRKAMMTQTFLNANPRMKQLLESYGFDANNPDATYDMIIAEARGMTEPKASEYKTFKPDEGIYRAGPQGLDVVREPQAGASSGKPPSGYRYAQDGQALEAIPGGPATKLPGDMAGRVAALQTAKESFADVRNFYEGQDWGDRASQLINSGSAGRVERNVRLAIEAALRAMTGAAAPESEVENYLNIFGPSALDTQATIKDKLDRLQSFMANVEANIAQGRSSAPGAPAQQVQPSPFPDYPNARQAQDGNWYVEQNGQYFRIDQ